MPKATRKVLTFILTSGVIYLFIALGLTLSQSPRTLPPEEGTLSFDSIDTDQARANDPGLESYTARDGTKLGLRRYPPTTPEAPLIVLVHGSGWHGGGYTTLGQGLADQLGYEVLIPDLRGHGVDPNRRGDVDYIGQLEDDLADLITQNSGADRPVSMVGHSSGGGLTIRFAGGEHGAMAHKAVLIAPFLHHAAPTARDNTGGWATVLTRRVIGQSMLNNVGITALNHLPMIQFKFPPSVLSGPLGHTATQRYSYRLNTSFAPRVRYLEDIAKLPDFLLIAGREDEAFVAQAYEPTMREATERGAYVLLEGDDHFSIFSNPEAVAKIADFLR